MRLFFLIIVISLSFVCGVVAQEPDLFDFELSVDKNFSLGQTPFFSYSIKANRPLEIEYYPYIKCPEGLNAFYEKKTISLRYQQKLEEVYEGTTIGDSWITQVCSAELHILKPIERIVKKDFTINGVQKLDFSINACRDIDCNKASRIFYQGEDVYLVALVDTDEVQIKAKLIDGTGLDSNINLPYKFIAKEGNYKLSVSAKKEGYIEKEQEIAFSVLSGPAKIESEKKCIIDSVCDKNETIKNCPQDCVFNKLEKKQSVIFVCSVVLLLLLLTIIFAIIYFNKKKKK